MAQFEGIDNVTIGDIPQIAGAGGKTFGFKRLISNKLSFYGTTIFPPNTTDITLEISGSFRIK